MEHHCELKRIIRTEASKFNNVILSSRNLINCIVHIFVLVIIICE